MNRLKFELRTLNVFFATAVAAVFILVDFAVWCAIGSPIYVLKFISSSFPSIPVWLFGLLDFLTFALWGFSLGAVLSNDCHSYDVHKYRGAFYFIIGVAMLFAHHVIFFVYVRFFVASIVSLVALAFVTVGILNFYNVSKISFVTAIAGGIWCLYIFLFSLAALFCT